MKEKMPQHKWENLYTNSEQTDHFQCQNVHIKHMCIHGQHFINAMSSNSIKHHLYFIWLSSDNLRHLVIIGKR